LAADFERRGVLVSDFDGTLAHPDFYELVRKHLVPGGTPDYWLAYRAGEMAHFDALRGFFEAAEGGEPALRRMVDMMRLPDDLPARLHRLQEAGWEVVVVSAGCSWYIDILLQQAGVRLPVYANPGWIRDGRLIMQRHSDSEHSCRETGVDKAAVTDSFQQQGCAVAFAGDGFPDFNAARLVPAKWRFARSDLATACRNEGIAFQAFDDWIEVADTLIRQPVR
jgi:2-hydroxy-3-keto-5-methylthiopentenyl-1-phosphate phosphatase